MEVLPSCPAFSIELFFLNVLRTVFVVGFWFLSFLQLKLWARILLEIGRASDILRKKKQNFAGFSGANSRKNRPISRHFRGKKVKIRGTIGRFREIFAGEKSKFAEKSAHFAGFLRKEVNFRRIFGGKFLGKSADFTGNFGGKLRQQTISRRQPISLGFSFFWQISLKSINFASIWPALVNVF